MSAVGELSGLVILTLSFVDLDPRLRSQPVAFELTPPESFVVAVMKHDFSSGHRSRFCPCVNFRPLQCSGLKTMSDANRLLYLRIALIVVGLLCIFGFYPLTLVWPSGWAWGHGYSHYLLMIIGLYATLGVFLLIASRAPYANKSLIWFTVWSSVVHGAFMGVQAFSDASERGHLIADVPALFLVAMVLAVLMPRTAQA